MKPRTTYHLFKYTERDGYTEFAHTTSPALAGTILRMCEAQAGASGALYEVRPALPPARQTTVNDLMTLEVV